MTPPVPKPPALRLIITYKLARAAMSLGGAVALAIASVGGATAQLHGLAHRVNLHATSALALELSSLLAGALEPRHLWIAVFGLLADGVMLLLEGWALHRGWRWGSWLVVATTAALVPFEVVALVHRVVAARVVLLVFNLAIVAYLVWLRLRRRALPEGSWLASGTPELVTGAAPRHVNRQSHSSAE